MLRRYDDDIALLSSTFLPASSSESLRFDNGLRLLAICFLLEIGLLLSHVLQFAPEAVKGLEAGTTKYWCACGLSKNQPWCDGLLLPRS
jgi:hypothetical protein